MDDFLEVELKFLAASAEPLARLAAAERLGRAELSRPRSFREVDRYLDSADGRLATAGWACRLRSRDERLLVSLKGPPRHVPEQSLHVRPEVEGPATTGDPTEWPPSAARDLLIRLSEGKPLVERLALLQRRTERTVRLRGTTGVLTLDEVTVLVSDATVGALHVVELELDGAATSSADPMGAMTELGDALGAIPGLAPDRLTKLEHALRMAGVPAP